MCCYLGPLCSVPVVCADSTLPLNVQMLLASRKAWVGEEARHMQTGAIRYFQTTANLR